MNPMIAITKGKVLICGLVLICVFAVLAAVQTNNIPTGLPSAFLGLNQGWGGETNQLRAGFVSSDQNRRGSKQQLIQVLVLNLNTNDAGGYVKPPSEKFLKVELRNSQNKAVAPRQGKNLEGDLPRSIPSEDLPRLPRSARSDPGLSGFLPLPQNIPSLLNEFYVQDMYEIKDEGDYTFTIWPAIYHFSTNKQSVARIDLLPVSMKIHLTISSEK